MKRLTRNPAPCATNPDTLSPLRSGGHEKHPWILLLPVMLVVLWGVGCGSSQNASQLQNSGPLSGNWQFTMASPSDNSFVGGLQGGFLLQNSQSVTGGAVYAVGLPQPPPTPPTMCSSGSAPISGQVNGQAVTLTVTAGAQTFNLSGNLSTDGSTMMGTYSSTDGKGCGTAQTGLKWSATSVQPLTGQVQGSFHSTGFGILANQDFPVSGLLTQGSNIGASNASVTGMLTFQGYPCLGTAYVNGQISGSSVVLQIFAPNGLDVGQIGAPVGYPNISPVVFESSASGGGYLLHGTGGYGLSTKGCPGGNSPGDSGNVCLALGSATGCAEPIVLSPATLTFPAQGLGSSATAQQITLTNNDPLNSALDGLTLEFDSPAGGTSLFGACSDFSGIPNFTESDNCGTRTTSGCTTSVGPFTLGPQKSCSITISFSPQQSCSWLPFGSPASEFGSAPALCPFPVSAKLKVTSPKSADNNKEFDVPIAGAGVSAIVPSTPEVDFGSEAVSEKSQPQAVSFTNQGPLPVQVLPALSTPPCGTPSSPYVPLPRPLAPGKVSDFQVVLGGSYPPKADQENSTVDYVCDLDPTSNEPNFQISGDTCSGRVLGPQNSCSLNVSFVPQPGTSFAPALDYFLELNTLQCTSNTTTDCEIDSGRFPVELKANLPSPLRMSPGAGLDFGTQAVGQTTNPLAITLFNDPKDPNSQTVNFTGNLVRGDYFETDDCGASLAPGGSCTLTITFTPKIVGYDPGTLTITYQVAQTQTVYLRGTGQ